MNKSQGPFKVAKPRWRPDGWTIKGPRAITVNAGVAISSEARLWYPDKRQADKLCKAFNRGLASGEIKLLEG